MDKPINILRQWYVRYVSDPQVVILAVLLVAGFAIMLTFGKMLAPVLAGVVVAYLLDGLEFVADNIHLDDGIFATAEAYRLVQEEGLTFRDAYRQVAKQYAK